MAKPIGSLAIAAVVTLLAGLCLVAGTGGDARCAPVPSMTVEQACDAVCGTPHMLKLCLRTLQPRARRGGGGGGEHRRRRDAITRYVGVAARGALDAYAATAAAKRGMQYSAALPTDERTAHERCMAGYDLAVRFMGRVAGDLASCETAAARLRDDCDGSLAGMDACRRKLFGYPASPLYSRNLADRNKTMLVGLLSNLVPAPTPPPTPSPSPSPET
uniref:Pectinesterase inhibitor domain-containing protein n=1 Tax=Oryza meridionalis TaxID=40149 RepID=A0A0E0EHR5_9ORYZ